jgi:signal transduction histidine kinase
MDFKKLFGTHLWLQELAFVCLFGLLSALMGMVEFQMPDFSGNATDLREIPILISVVYLRHFISIIGVILFSVLSMHEEGAFVSYFLMHFAAAIFLWFAYQKIKSNNNFNNFKVGVSWSSITLVYYAIIIPVYIISENIFQNNSLPFYASVVSMTNTAKFEIITTGLVTSLYIIQNNIRKQLREHKINLERIVKERTMALTESNQQLLSLNEELTSSTEEVRALNDNLEKIVHSRTEKINTQLKQLEKYAHMNSHEVRGPLARVLGLVGLIKIDKQNGADPAIIDKLEVAAEELDEVVKKMNLLLEIEVDRKNI